jgi:hypothetical protein
MARKLWPLLLLGVGGCSSSGSESDLQYIKQARSLGAEWALVNEQAAQGKLIDTYATTMRKRLRDQLQTTSRSLTQPDSRYGREIHALLAEPDAASPTALRSHARALEQIGDSLESA